MPALECPSCHTPMDEIVEPDVAKEALSLADIRPLQQFSWLLSAQHSEVVAKVFTKIMGPSDSPEQGSKSSSSKPGKASAKRGKKDNVQDMLSTLFT